MGPSLMIASCCNIAFDPQNTGAAPKRSADWATNRYANRGVERGVNQRL